MYLKIIKNSTQIKQASSKEGFSLLETTIALVTLGICLAYAMPLFLYAKLNNSKTEIRTGALIVAQKAFDNIRSQSIIELPKTDGQLSPNLSGCTYPTANPPNLIGCKNSATGANPRITPNVKDISIATVGTTANPDTNIMTPLEKSLTTAIGRQYQTKVTYCGNLPADPSSCNDRTRKFKVEVSFNGTKVYDLEGTYTNFD